MGERRTDMHPTARRRAATIVGLAIVVLLSAVACGSNSSSVDSGSGSTAPGAPTRSTLDGRTFVSTSVTASGVDRPLAGGQPITMTFDGKTLRASPGCNGVGGTYSLDGDRLTVTELSSTAMACADTAAMDQDTWFGGLLEAGPTLTLAGDQLTMTSADTVIVFVDRETADPDRPLVGTDWKLESIITGEVASSVPSGASASLQLPDGSHLTWQGCNSGGAPVPSMTPTSFTVGEMVSSQKGCVGPAAEVDAAMAGVLHSTVTYDIEGPVLHLRNGSNGLDLRAA